MQNAHKSRGIGVLLANLLPEMGRLCGADEITLLSLAGKDLPQLFPDQKLVATRRIERPNRFNWIADEFFLPGLVRRSGAELFFATDINSYLVPQNRVKIVSMVYDLIPFIFPEVMASQPLPVRAGWKVNFDKLRNSDQVIAISAATKHDLIRMMGLNPDKIKVICPGIEHNLFNVGNASAELRQAALKERFGISGRYLLYVGDSEWRKNLRRCLEALIGVDNELKLVLVGRRAATDAKLHGWIEELGLKKRVITTGFVEDIDLPPLYGAAEAFLFPSLYEGFGLPIAEAMACGCPVITAKVSSMPEVVGDAGILVNPQSVDDIRAAIIRVSGNNVVRRELSALGVMQAAQFSWERAAMETLELFREMSG